MSDLICTAPIHQDNSPMLCEYPIEEMGCPAFQSDGDETEFAECLDPLDAIQEHQRFLQMTQVTRRPPTHTKYTSKRLPPSLPHSRAMETGDKIALGALVVGGILLGGPAGWGIALLGALGAAAGCGGASSGSVTKSGAGHTPDGGMTGGEVGIIDASRDARMDAGRDGEKEKRCAKGIDLLPDWTVTYNRISHDNGYGIAIDQSGDVYVIGHELTGSEGQNIWINKYNSDGNPLWSNPISYNGPANGIDIGQGITVDQAGNIYVTGSETVISQIQGNWNIWINKYDSDGNPLWPNPISYNGSANAIDIGQGITVDQAGNIYVTGSEGVLEEDANVWINKYDSDGNPLWPNPVSYNGPDNGEDEGREITLDQTGNIYVTGSETVLGEEQNIWVNKYDTNGNPLWSNPITYNGLGNEVDIGYAITLDQAGNIYVTGHEWVPRQGSNIWIRKYIQCSKP